MQGMHLPDTGTQIILIGAIGFLLLSLVVIFTSAPWWLLCSIFGLTGDAEIGACILERRQPKGEKP